MTAFLRPSWAAWLGIVLGPLANGPVVAGTVDESEIRIAVDSLHPAGTTRRYWLDAAGRPSRQALALLAEMQDAAVRGLDPQDYGAAELRRRATGLGLAKLDTADAFEHDFTHALTRFIVHLDRGRIRPEEAGYALAPRRLSPDLAERLRALSAAADVSASLDALEPRYRHFALLKLALKHYRALAASVSDAMLPGLPSKRIRPGEAYADVATLRLRLQQLGDLPAIDGPAAMASQLDADTVTALRAFQRRHGLEDDGVLGQATHQALNVPLRHRVAQIEWSMERVRWLPPPPEGPFIVVNIPQFRLFAFRGPFDAEQSMTAMNVIVGKTFPRFRTPVFMASIRQVVFRPYWDVPRSILRNEVLPELRREPSRVAREGYEAVRGQRDDSSVVPWSSAVADDLSAGSLRLRQRPGPRNALGDVKFLLPNPYDVYLHSTPARSLFGRSRRAFSHGCVRVEDPVTLARFVFGEGAGWDEARIRSAQSEGPASARYPVPQPVPVMVFYATAVAAEDGQARFFDDLYGHDDRLRALLGR